MCAAASPSLAKLQQELFRRHIERILLKDTADDDHRMGPHDVNHRVSSKLPQMVSTDNRVVMAAPHVVDTRLELNHVVDIGLVMTRPIHSAANAAEGKTSLGVTAGQGFEHAQHAILIEAAIGKIDFGVDPKLQLSALLRRLRIDSRGSQASQMVRMLRGVQDMNGFVAGFQPVFYER